jgi:hypothetical protein
VTPSEPLEALPDLTLSEAGERWGVSSRNSVKARAAALGVELRRESSTRTVWPAEFVPLGDRLAEHLQHGGTLASFPGAMPSLTAATDGSDGVSQTAPMAPGDGSKGPRRSAGLSLTAPTAGSDGLAALAQLAAALAPPPPPADPLAVARGLAEAAQLGAWLTTAELARLLGVARGTVGSWDSGHVPRPGFELERRKEGSPNRGGAVWWRVVAEAERKEGPKPARQ